MHTHRGGMESDAMTRGEADALAELVAHVIDTTPLERVSVGILRKRMSPRPTWAKTKTMRAELLEHYPELGRFVLEDAHLAEHDERRRIDAHPDGAGMDWQEIKERRRLG